jgi:hypothetical protein
MFKTYQDLEHSKIFSNLVILTQNSNKQNHKNNLNHVNQRLYNKFSNQPNINLFHLYHIIDLTKINFIFNNKSKFIKTNFQKIKNKMENKIDY